MFGGMGGGRSGLRAIRLAMLAGILIIGATLHHSGSTYHVIDAVYLVVVVGIVLVTIAMRRGGRRQRGGGGPGGLGSQPTGRGGFGAPPPPPRAGYHDNPDPESSD